MSHEKNPPPLENQNTLAFLIKSNAAKKNELNKNSAQQNNGESHNLTDIWRDASQINKNRTSNITNNFAADGDNALADIWRDASQINKNRNNNNTSKTNYSFESMSVDVDDVLKSPVFSTKKISNDTITKLMFNNSSSGNTDTNKQPFKTREKTFGSFSENDEVSHSINDLMNKSNQIKNNENERIKLVHESSVDFLLKNNLIPGNGDKNEGGLAQLFGELNKKDSLKKQNSTEAAFGSPKKVSRTKSDEVDVDSFERSESLDDLEASFNKIINKQDKAQPTE